MAAHAPDPQTRRMVPVGTGVDRGRTPASVAVAVRSVDPSPTVIMWPASMRLDYPVSAGAGWIEGKSLALVAVGIVALAVDPR